MVFIPGDRAEERILRHLGPHFLLVGCLSLWGSVSSAAPVFPTKVAAQLESLVDRGEIPGAVVALIDPTGITFKSFGVDGPGGHQKPTPRTLYEIGSVTKVFTTLLLADMVIRGEVSLSDPAEKWLVPKMNTPRRDGRTFTLLDLATHRSGLDDNVPDFWSLSKMKDAELENYLRSAHLLSAPGQKLLYSNFGICVLGRALADRSNRDFGELLSERVLKPLHLDDTMLTVPPGRLGNLAKGYDGQRAVEWLTLEAARPAGGLKSSASDLARFLKLEMGQLDSPLRKAMDLSQEKQNGREPLDLGWFYIQFKSGPIYRHTGMTPGARSWIYFMPSKGLGLVLLTDSTEEMGSFADTLFMSLNPGEVDKQWMVK